MRTTLLLTVVGPDRTGLVESLAQRIAEAGGNWEASRLARLAGQFAGIVTVSVDTARVDGLVAALRAVTGCAVTARAIAAPASGPTGSRVRLVVTGDDRPGIVRDVCGRLAARGVNVEEFESSVSSAPMSGEAMFVARAQLVVPSQVALRDVQSDLESLGNELMVDFAAE